MPGEVVEDDLAQRIDDHVADRERLQQMVGDRAQELVELTRRFRGEAALNAPPRSISPSLAATAANRLNPMTRERSFSTFQAWRRFMKQIDPNVRFEGDRDIAFAFDGNGRGLGEWDGARGTVYAAKAKPTGPGPRLQKLLDDGVVRNEGGYYIGTAADGTDVQIGSVLDDPQSIESYLTEYPGPRHW
jgi:hypothetical protein